jgi:hypothetical protein
LLFSLACTGPAVTPEPVPEMSPVHASEAPTPVAVAPPAVGIRPLLVGSRISEVRFETIDGGELGVPTDGYVVLELIRSVDW